MKEKWVSMPSKKADLALLSKKYEVSPIIIKLIMNRVNNESDIEMYINGTLNNLAPAYTMKGLKEAADIIGKIRAAAHGKTENAEKIAIVSDYDCDGIFSGMILHTGFKTLGIDSQIYTPDRIAEGYGINNRIIDEIYESGIRNIITCDNGIASFDEIRYAKELGMTVIVTDHHEVPYRDTESGKEYIIPEAADAVCDPKQEDCGYAYDSLCGAGVAYRLIEYLYDVHNIAPEKKDILVQYAAIATVADVMDLTGENRIIVREGLKLLSQTTDVGLSAIKKAVGIDGAEISAYHIGFIIGPCFNAAGRIQSAKLAFDLLMCDNEQEAEKLAILLKDLNDERKCITESATDYCMQLAKEGKFDNDKIVVIYIPECHESIVGIVAGRVKEKICKPVIVFTDGENGILKGSGRSIEAYNMFEELNKERDLFIKFGGHAMAAGITMEKGKFEELRCRLNEKTTLTEDDFYSKVEIDMQLPAGCINEELLNELNIIEPCGKANNKPLFVITHAAVKNVRIVGKNSDVVKLRLADGNGYEINAVLFNRKDDFLQMIKEDFGEEQLELMLHCRPNNIDIAVTFYPNINEYNGNRSIELIIQNFNRII